MKKKLIVIAVAGALGAPAGALAQASNVQLNGNINILYGYYDHGGTGFTTPFANTVGVAKARADAMNSVESEWSLKGEESLGGGTAAWFQCNTTFDIARAPASNMCGRNSAIGLKGSFGNVFFGNWVTPTRAMIGQYSPFPLTSPLGNAMLFAGAGEGVSNTSLNASFARRQNNLLTYAMPTMNGFDAQFAYSATNEATGVTSATTIQKPRLWSAMVNYRNGPLMLGAGYERHIDYNNGIAVLLGTAYAGGRDSSYQLGASYTFGNSLKVSAVFVNLKYEFGAAGDASANTLGVYGDWAISGPHRLRAGYSKIGDTKGTFTGLAVAGTFTGNGGAGQTGAQKYSFEYAYAMSKRTELSLGYARLNNDRNASQTLSSTGIGTTAVGNIPNYGETQTYTGLGLKHSF